MGTKKSILIFGLTSNYGGTEKITYAFLSHLDCAEYNLTFVINSKAMIITDDKIKQFDCKTLYLNTKRKGRYKAFKNELKELFRLAKPDIVLEVFGDSTFVEPLVYAKKFSVTKRMALATMGNDVKTPNIFYRFIRYIAKIRLNNSVTHYLSVSSKSSLYTFGKSKPVTIVSGINSEQFKYNEEDRANLRNVYSIKDKDIVFSSIGRICPDKNQMFAVDFFSSYHSYNKNSYLFLIGNYEDEYFNVLNKHINSLGIQNNVFFIESQPEVKKFYSFSDIILFPSLREGFGLIALESQANGVPCLVFEETIDSSLKISDKLVFIEKEIKIDAVTNLIDSLVKKSFDRKNAYQIIKKSPLDLSNQEKKIRDLFE